jgi:hypothetical protein
MKNMKRAVHSVLCCLLVGASVVMGAGGPKIPDLPWVQMKNGHLFYAEDPEHNRIPDFSTVGYEEGEAGIPDVPVKLRVEAPAGRDAAGQDAALQDAAERDATGLIQSAIESMSKLPLDAHGIRGAVLLGPGTFRIAGTVQLDVSGVVLRGSGTGADGTMLVAEGLPHTVLHVGGIGAWKEVRARRSIVDDYVPLGAQAVTVDAPDDFFSVGDRVIVQWNMSESFIHNLGMDRIPGRRDGREVRQWPTSFALRFDRRVVAMEKTEKGYLLKLDAPLTQPMAKVDGAVVWKYEFPERVSQVGVENMQSDGTAFRKAPNYNNGTTPEEKNGSFFDSIFSDFETVENAWMRNVHVEGYNNIVYVHQHGRAITVEDVEGDHIDTPLKEGRAAPFAFNVDGQQVLMQRCNLTGRLNHVWTTQARVAGPNVFRDSWAKGSDLDAGPHHRWATGTLYEQLTLKGRFDAYNQWNLGTGHGWAGAYTVLYNSAMDEIQVESPPGAYNWVINSKGRQDHPQAGALGAFYESGDQVELPASLYEEQLKERIARKQQGGLR